MFGMLMSHLKYVRATRRRLVRSVPEHKMEPEEINQALAGIVESAGWRALHQLLDEEIAQAVDHVSEQPRADELGPINRDFSAGGVDYLRGFQRVLLEKQAVVSQADTDIEGE